MSTELSLITLHWFLTAFASVVHIRVLLRLWDLFFYEGSLVLFQTTLGMLRLKVLPEPCPAWGPSSGGLLWGFAFCIVWPDHWPLLGGPRCGGVPQGPEVLVSAWSLGRSPGPLAGLASGSNGPSCPPSLAWPRKRS